jgi:hypothetical protein
MYPKQLKIARFPKAFVANFILLFYSQFYWSDMKELVLFVFISNLTSLLASTRLLID